MARRLEGDAGGERRSVYRRDFLNLAWLASLGFLTVDLGAVTYFFSLPRFKQGQFGGKFPLGPVADLPPAGTPPINYPQGRFWLSHTDRGWLALYKVCTHLGCLYLWESGLDRFRCPCHGSEFLADGALFKTPARRSLDRFVIQAVSIVTGEVLSETDATTGQPLAVPEDPSVILQVDTSRRLLGQKR